MSAFTHPKDIFPWRGLNTGAKVVKYFGLSKKNAVLKRFFWCRVDCVRYKGEDLLGGLPPSTKPVVGIKHVHE